jgi:hypothetical protein
MAHEKSPPQACVRAQAARRAQRALMRDYSPDSRRHLAFYDRFSKIGSL